MNIIRKIYILLVIFFATYVEVRAQEPFTFNPEDNHPTAIPEGMSGEEYLKKIYQETHLKIKITFRVVDEEGTPIPEADIDVGIDSFFHFDGFNNYIGKTDAQGLFTVESRGMGCSEVKIEKEGYYTSRPEYKWDAELNPSGSEIRKNGGFRPWNPVVDVMLRPIVKPIPMRVWYTRTSHLAPAAGQEYGFDFYENDWVEPHGKGHVADALIQFTSDFKDERNFKTTCLIRFANPDDGLIPIPEYVSTDSLLKYPREAPADGYLMKEMLLKNELSIEPGPFMPNQAIGDENLEPIGYFIRFRTERDGKSAKISSAYYGKITVRSGASFLENPIKVGSVDLVDRKIVEMPYFKFKYYLNTTPNDRNLEYDQRTNLAPDAPEASFYLP